MPPPSLSTTTMVMSMVAIGGTQQAVAVVEEGEVTEQRDRRSSRGRDTDCGRDHAVDAVGPAVGEDRDVRTRGGEPLDVADRHR